MEKYLNLVQDRVDSDTGKMMILIAFVSYL